MRGRGKRGAICEAQAPPPKACTAISITGELIQLRDTTNWSAQEQAFLIHIWNTGCTAAQCAGQLTIKFSRSRTRNAVVSKIDRMREQGIKLRDAGGEKSRRAKRNAHGPKPAPQPRSTFNPPAPTKAPERHNGPDLVIPVAERKTFEALPPTGCKWPFGHPGKPDFHFCGKERVPGKPYCEFHTWRAYQAPVMQRRASEHERATESGSSKQLEPVES